MLQALSQLKHICRLYANEFNLATPDCLHNICIAQCCDNLVVLPTLKITISVQDNVRLTVLNFHCMYWSYGIVRYVSSRGSMKV